MYALLSKANTICHTAKFYNVHVAFSDIADGENEISIEIL